MYIVSATQFRILCYSLKLRHLSFVIWKIMDLHGMILDLFKLQQSIIIKDRTDYRRSRVREFHISHWLTQAEIASGMLRKHN